MPAVAVATPMPIMLREPSFMPCTTSTKPLRQRAGGGLAAEELDQPALRQHQHDQHRDGPEGRQRGRHLLDHQAPDQRGDGHQEVQPGLAPWARCPAPSGCRCRCPAAGRGSAPPRARHTGRSPPSPRRWPRPACSPSIDFRPRTGSTAARHDDDAARQPQPQAQHGVAPGARHAVDDRHHAQLQRLEVHDVQQPQVGQRRRQQRMLDDLAVRECRRTRPSGRRPRPSPAA